MKFDIPKIIKFIIIVFCLLTILAVLNRGSPRQIVALASVPIALIITCMIMPNIKIEEYPSMFMLIHANCNDTSIYSNKIIHIIRTYIGQKKSAPDLLYVNCKSLIVFKDIKSALGSSEQAMLTISERLYSRIVVANGRGYYTEKDQKYIKDYIADGKEAIEKTSELLNEISEMNRKTVDLSHITYYTEALRELNNRVKGGH